MRNCNTCRWYPVGETHHVNDNFLGIPYHFLGKLSNLAWVCPSPLNWHCQDFGSACCWKMFLCTPWRPYLSVCPTERALWVGTAYMWSPEQVLLRYQYICFQTYSQPSHLWQYLLTWLSNPILTFPSTALCQVDGFVEQFEAECFINSKHVKYYNHN